MVNTNLFPSKVRPVEPKVPATVEAALTFNHAGGIAYEFKEKHALAQYAVTGCMNNTFYSTGQEQLETVKKLCENVDPEFIGKTALYARTQGYMKDMPALLVAVLAKKSPEVLSKVFPEVIDDAKMLRNFVQIMRSGTLGKTSICGAAKRLCKEWFENRSEEQIFRQSTGDKPSLGDVIGLVHPKPGSESKAALFGYLRGKCRNPEQLPAIVKHYEALKAGERQDLPNLSFMHLSSLPLSEQQWKDLAAQSSWQTLRMNLNTFQRHGVFSDEGAVELAAQKLADKSEVERAKAFPYQLLAAFRAAGEEVPTIVTLALQDAMEHAVSNIPKFGGKVYVLPDVSGSMSDPVTGYRTGSTTKMTCQDISALVSAAVLRNNPTAEILPFDTSVHPTALNPRDSVMTNANILAKYGGGGTNCSLPLAALNARNAKGDLVIFVSDNESWMDSGLWGRGTETMRQWNIYKSRNPNAKLVCIDVTPNRTTQASNRDDILNVGGFSDKVFDVIDLFHKQGMAGGQWVDQIERIKL